ncbi:MAG TPA: SLC13 family permease [Gemmatales bacterium]|nr:SLC13 family permease [Gemmatales bacterium]HMP59396.1 SLC13 family permease [Gemmatales bacterium]
MNPGWLVLLADSAGSSGDKPWLPMIVLGAIMTVTYFFIAFEWLHKSLAAMLGAIAAVAAAMAFGVFREEGGHTPYDRAVHDIIGHDIGVIGVLVGTSVLVDVASRSGLFHFLAIKLVKQTRGDPLRLHTFIAIATVLFVTFLTITPGTLIMVSLVLVVTRELELDPKPYVLTVAICANSGALMTFASGICTLMLGTAGNLPYMHFFRVSTPMAILSAILATIYLRRFYRSSLDVPGDPEERARKVAAFDEWALVKDRGLFYRCAFILGGTIVGFASAQQLGVGIDFIAFCGGTAALLLSGYSTDEAIKKVNWSVVLFFVGLFVIIGSVQESGLLDWQARQMIALAGGSPVVTMLLVATFVLALSGIVDNIPVAATLIPIVRAMEQQGIPAEPLWWALVLAANLGGNSTPVGSISSVIALHALEKERGVKVSWGEYLKVGGMITVLQTVLVLIYLSLFAYFDLFPTR